MDTKTHMDYTGVGNELILENFNVPDEATIEKLKRILNGKQQNKKVRKELENSKQLK